jgi:hypothetical protein
MRLSTWNPFFPGITKDMLNNAKDCELGNERYALDMSQGATACSEFVFLNVYGAQESIPGNEFRQPM